MTRPIMYAKEIPLVFDCRGEKLIGIIHQADGQSKVGILIVVGGPQYRIGSHRQFVLLARYLATQGIPVMRFDVRGMGDAEGEQRSFTTIDEDIATAIDHFLSTCPELEGVVIWGLCDAASATLFYAYRDDRIKGLVLLNPWVFTEQGAAKTYLKHYYLQRLMSRDFWNKILSFKFDYSHSLTSLLNLLKQASAKNETLKPVQTAVKVDESLSLPIRMRECLKRFTGPVLFILSGRDLTADEFKEAVKDDPEWQSLLKKPLITLHDFAEADHTFSSAAWREKVAYWTKEWMLKTVNPS